MIGIKEKKMEKRGISTLVAEVLVILITLTAAGIIWGVVIPMIQKITQAQQICMNAYLDINKERGYTCYSLTDRVTQVMVDRGPEKFELSGIQIILKKGGTSISYYIREGSGTALNTIYTAKLPQEDESDTYIIPYEAEEVSIAPIVKIGKTEKICEATSTAKLSQCG